MAYKCTRCKKVSRGKKSKGITSFHKKHRCPGCGSFYFIEVGDELGLAIDFEELIFDFVGEYIPESPQEEAYEKEPLDESPVDEEPYNDGEPVVEEYSPIPAVNELPGMQPEEDRVCKEDPSPSFDNEDNSRYSHTTFSDTPSDDNSGWGSSSSSSSFDSGSSYDSGSSCDSGSSDW